MKRNQAIRLEVRAILASPKFERSSVLSAILEYLAEAELGGRDAPTQEVIAADVFEKDLAQWDPADSSVRVAISRLRTALEEYYLVHQPGDTHCIHVRKGEYRLRFASIDLAYPNIAAVTQKYSAEADLGEAFADSDVPCAVEYREPVTQIDLETDSIVVPGSYSQVRAKDPESRMSQVTHTTTAAEVSALAVDDQVASSSDKASDASSQGAHSRLFAMTRRGEFAEVPPPWIKVLLSVAALFAAIWSTVNLQPTRTAVAAIGERSAVEVPYVAAHIDFDGKGSHKRHSAELVGELNAEVSKLLRKSMISRFEERADAKVSDFNLRIGVIEVQSGYASDVVLTDIQGRVVAERSFSHLASVGELKDAINDEIVALISPNGHIARFLLDRFGDEPRNGYECFLFVEGMRATVEEYAQTLDRCIADYENSEFIPHLEARRAFTTAQKTLLSGGKLSLDNESWRTVSRLLSEHPDNPYANTVAAKLLIGRGMCREAAAFASDAFSRGRTYPTLELSVIVDAYGCDETANVRPFWKARIEKIARAYPDPDPLTESYLLLGTMVSGQPDLLRVQKSTLFFSSSNPALNQFNAALRNLAKGRASEQDRMIVHDRLPAMLFHGATREMILSRGNH